MKTIINEIRLSFYFIFFSFLLLQLPSFAQSTGDFGFELSSSPEDDLDIDLATNAVQQDQCQEACNQAQSALQQRPHRGNHTPCHGININRFYCEGSNSSGDRIIDPFKVFGNRDNTAQDMNLSDQCRLYLLYRAKQQFSRISNNGSSSTADSAQRRADFSAFLDLAPRTVGICGRSMGADSLQTLIRNFESTTHQLLGPEDTARGSREYCAQFRPNCESMGGRMRTIQARDGEGHTQSRSQQSCVVGGLVIDPSCYRTHAVANKLKTAINAMKGPRGGVSCLNNLGGQAAMAGQGLSDHLEGRLEDTNSSRYSPSTQICCGTNGNCQNSVFPGNDEPLGSGARAQASSGPYGTLKLGPSFFRSNTNNANATLFHEMLHRQGLCSSAHHNIGNLRVNGNDRTGATAHLGAGTVHEFSNPPLQCSSPRGSRPQSVCQLIDPTIQANPCRNPNSSSQLRCQVFSALYTYSISNGQPNQSEFSLENCLGTGGLLCVQEKLNDCAITYPVTTIDDPIYACERACFGTSPPERPTDPTLQRLYPPYSREQDRETCRSRITRTGTFGYCPTQDKRQRAQNGIE